MTDVKWIKIAIDIFDNRKIKQIEKMPDGDAVIVIWIKLLCLAGNVNDDGFIYLTREIPYTDEMLATEFSKPVQTVRMALSVFQQFEMIELIDNIYHVSSWSKYQDTDGLARIREQARERKQKQREREALLCKSQGQSHELSRDSHVTVTDDVTQCHAPRIRNKDIDIKNNKEKEIIKKEKPPSSDVERILSEFIIDERVKDTIRDFVKMRKLIKAPMTDTAIKLMINKLRNMTLNPDEQIAILNQSIENSWKGIFPLKDPGSGRNRAADELNQSYAMMAAWAGRE